MALRNSSESQEFMEVRSITCWPGNTSSSCGQTYPEKLSVSTAVMMVGTWNNLEALASRVTLLIRSARLMLATPKVIWG